MDDQTGGLANDEIGKNKIDTRFINKKHTFVTTRLVFSNRHDRHDRHDFLVL